MMDARKTLYRAQRLAVVAVAAIAVAAGCIWIAAHTLSSARASLAEGGQALSDCRARLDDGTELLAGSADSLVKCIDDRDAYLGLLVQVCGPDAGVGEL